MSLGQKYSDFDAMYVETGKVVSLNQFVGIEIPPAADDEDALCVGGPVVITFYTSW